MLGLALTVVPLGIAIRCSDAKVCAILRKGGADAMREERGNTTESEETEGAVRRSTSSPFGKGKAQRDLAPSYALPPIPHSLGCGHPPGFILLSDPHWGAPCGSHQQYNSKGVGTAEPTHLPHSTTFSRNSCGLARSKCAPADHLKTDGLNTRRKVGSTNQSWHPQ